MSMRGRTLSKEHRRKIGKAHFGKKRSAKARHNMSKALKGRRFSREWKRNMSLARLGGIRSEAAAKRHFQREGFNVYQNGWPDFLIVKGKEFHFVEVKRRPDRNHIRGAQHLMHEALRSVGIDVQIWWKGKK